MLFSILLEIVAFALLGALGFIFHDRADQPLIRRDLIIDVIYFLGGLLVYGQIIGWIYGHVQPPSPVRIISRWPLWAQIAVLVVAYDAMQYALHRWLHGDALWPCHAVHHSAQEIDVMTSFRNHPMNFLIGVGLPTAALLLMGFSPAAFAALAPFNFAMAALVHANLNWTYGPFRYVLSSPMFHRWHHAIVEGSQSRNYAPNFPIWDLMFGTFHMPKGEAPLAYGAPEVPDRFIGQLVYPFRARTAA
jgi:sterol desaturase/sphingolipid hydroxylase (fatty acid hydroxylase superfamily)